MQGKKEYFLQDKDFKPCLELEKEEDGQDEFDKRQITIHNAHIHNLKNITVPIPKNKITLITGVSGSGKSSLAFDTLLLKVKDILSICFCPIKCFQIA